MTWTRLFMLVGAGLAVACSKADSSATAGPAEVADNGQTGSSGYECTNDWCQASAQLWLDWVNDTSVPTFVDSLCQSGSNVGSAETLTVQSCKCIGDDGTFRLVAATGSAGFGSALPDAGAPTGAGGAGPTPESAVWTEPCLAWGRGHLGCTYPASEASSCDVGTPSSCDRICARLQQGIADDAARTYDVSLRVALCRPRDPGGDPSGGSCDRIASINGDCYATSSAGFFEPTKYDCSLSDEEIFAQRDQL